jgi:hypothetical protein
MLEVGPKQQLGQKTSAADMIVFARYPGKTMQ